MVSKEVKLKRKIIELKEEPATKRVQNIQRNNTKTSGEVIVWKIPQFILWNWKRWFSHVLTLWIAFTESFHNFPIKISLFSFVHDIKLGGQFSVLWYIHWMEFLAAIIFHKIDQYWSIFTIGRGFPSTSTSTQIVNWRPFYEYSFGINSCCDICG